MKYEDAYRLMPDIPKEWIDDTDSTYRESKLLEHLLTTRAEVERLNLALESMSRAYLDGDYKAMRLIMVEALAAKE